MKFENLKFESICYIVVSIFFTKNFFGLLLLFNKYYECKRIDDFLTLGEREQLELSMVTNVYIIAFTIILFIVISHSRTILVYLYTLILLCCLFVSGMYKVYILPLFPYRGRKF